MSIGGEMQKVNFETTLSSTLFEKVNYEPL